MAKKDNNALYVVFGWLLINISHCLAISSDERICFALTVGLQVKKESFKNSSDILYTLPPDVRGRNVFVLGIGIPLLGGTYLEEH